MPVYLRLGALLYALGGLILAIGAAIGYTFAAYVALDALRELATGQGSWTRTFAHAFGFAGVAALMHREAKQ